MHMKELKKNSWVMHPTKEILLSSAMKFDNSLGIVTEIYQTSMKEW